MSTYIAFIQFNSIEQMENFIVTNAFPEREDNVLGMFDGILVYPRIVYDDDTEDYHISVDMDRYDFDCMEKDEILESSYIPKNRDTV